MLTSLFGDLGAARAASSGTAPQSGETPDDGFAAVPLMQRVDTVIDEHGRMVERHLHDLVVSGSPAQAIREHFETTRPELESGSRIITLLDPVGTWASAVVKALSDAGGRPIERLHLRERDSLRTLAMIERTTLARRNEETLKVYHAEVRAPGRENAEIPFALMERSHMTTVIVGPKHPHAIDALLESVREATALPTWRCPNLLFMLPPNAAWIAGKVGSVTWPPGLRVHVSSESLSSASAVWNAMLDMWNHVKDKPSSALSVARAEWADSAAPQAGELDAADAAVQALGAPAGSPDFANTEPFVVAQPAPRAAPVRHPPTPDQARLALTPLLDLDGLLGCAVVDTSTGSTLASRWLAASPLDMERVADSVSQIYRAQRLAARGMGFAEAPDEALIGAGARRMVIHSLPQHPDLLLVVLLDRALGDLVRCRRKLSEVQSQLG